MTRASRSVTLVFEHSSSARIHRVTRVALIGISALMIPIAMQAPAVTQFSNSTDLQAVSLYWATSTAYSTIQNILMRKYLPTAPPYLHRMQRPPGNG